MKAPVVPAAHGDWPVKPNPPSVPGREGVGPVGKPGMTVGPPAPVDASMDEVRRGALKPCIVLDLGTGR